MTADQKRRWIAEQGWAASSAIETLKTAKRVSTSEYDQCIRELLEFIKRIRITEIDGQQLELFEPQAVLSPEIKKLLADPLHRIE